MLTTENIWLLLSVTFTENVSEHHEYIANNIAIASYLFCPRQTSCAACPVFIIIIR